MLPSVSRKVEKRWPRARRTKAFLRSSHGVISAAGLGSVEQPVAGILLLSE